MNQYRSVLEVLKLTDEKTTIASTEVCSTWSRAASSEELYREKCESEIFGPNSQVSCLSFKAMYQSYLQTRTDISHVLRSTIRSFSCTRQMWNKPLRLNGQVQLGLSSPWVLLPDGNILSCGGSSPFPDFIWSQVYLLQRRGVVKELAPLNEAKTNHKCIFLANAVYVFGGYHPSPDSTPNLNEKLEISSWPISKKVHWKRLPDMLRPRSEVCLCGQGNCIYLIGEGVAEMFDCETEIYTLLSPSIPVNSPYYGVFHNGEIVFISQDRVFKWNLESNEVASIMIEGKFRLETGNFTSPVVVGNSLFMPHGRNTIAMIDLVTGVLRLF